MRYEDLLKAFAEQHGIGDFPRPDGTAAIEIDGMPVVFLHEPEKDRLILFGIVGDPPPEAAGRFGALLLQGNFLFGTTDECTLAQNPENEAYVLQRPFRLDDLDPDSLSTALESFANTLERWRKLLEDFRPIEESANKRAAEEAAIPALGNDMFFPA